MEGDAVPVSVFVDNANGSIPAGTAAYEKRGIAVDIPKWDPTKCMQCNWCSYVCPHAVIRPFAVTEQQAEEAGAASIPLKEGGERRFTIAVSAYDCTGCGSCVEVCPARNKALEMVLAEDHMDQAQAGYDYLFENVKEDKELAQPDSVRGSQFRQPLLEFSGACPGCGETPYAKTGNSAVW